MSEQCVASVSCRACIYWSELIAKTKNGRMLAVCLSEGGYCAGQYTDEEASCGAWRRATEGAIDATWIAWSA